MPRTTVAAVDLGASSGRVVLGRVAPGTLEVEVVHRFPNIPVRTPDGLHWNVLELYRQALEGLRVAVAASDEQVASVAVDSWAVDYALLRGGRLLGVPFHYRDEARSTGSDEVHELISQEELYVRNGLQYLPFTTLYQLARDPWVADADQLLLIPDFLGFWLTGQGVAERTNASTTGLLDVRTRSWDDALVTRLGVPRRVLAPLIDPGDPVGRLLPELADAVGAGLEVTAVGSHDTASAVVGVPLQRDDAAYISCGTWGLVGVELDGPVITEASRAANFTNEGGVDGRVRFLTNVMGTWLLSETMRVWERAGETDELDDLLQAAAQVTGRVPVIDVQDPRFVPPGDMPSRIGAWCEENGVRPPAGRAETVRTIIESLAQAFAEAVQAASDLSGRAVSVVHLVGGGALNELLCQAVADRCGRTVLAGPVEATALGNVLVQARARGAVTGSLESLRHLITTTHVPRSFTPSQRAVRMGP